MRRAHRLLQRGKITERDEACCRRKGKVWKLERTRNLLRAKLDEDIVLLATLSEDPGLQSCDVSPEHIGEILRIEIQPRHPESVGNHLNLRAACPPVEIHINHTVNAAENLHDLHGKVVQSAYFLSPDNNLYRLSANAAASTSGSDARLHIRERCQKRTERSRKSKAARPVRRILKINAHCGTVQS